jgi:hypothetical protein
MKFRITGILYASCLTSLLLSCEPKEKESLQVGTVSIPQTNNQDLIQRGKYLTTIAGCNDCHSPKIMTDHGPALDPSRLLSGHPQYETTPPILKDNRGWILFSPGLTAFVGPWGTSYAANLTPDDTGIGNWTFEQFERAIRKVKYKGLEAGRTLLPPMPWQMYKDMNDDDLQSIFAYLKSLKPVSNTVPSPAPPKSI